MRKNKNRLHLEVTGWVKQVVSGAAKLLHLSSLSVAKVLEATSDLQPSTSVLLIPDEMKQSIHLRLAEIVSSAASADPAPDAQLTTDEKQWIARIHDETDHANRNNVTRTAAYLSFFQQYPEVHWAFLAHMVSRNGGWNMTDLKGELLPRLLDEGQIEAMFAFLERANSFIFQDAYPQLLLYRESRRANRSLFHLLPRFYVSRYMGPVWEEFWQTRNSVLLTIGLIVNEQHYIEGRVVRDPWLQAHVFDTLLYKMQSLLQLNQVILPYRDETISGPEHSNELAYTGLTLEDFTDVKERINVGKKLYALLFGRSQVQLSARIFAEHVPHSGSRIDCWPQLFKSVRLNPPSKLFQPRLSGCQLAPGAAPLYSPQLKVAWPNRPLQQPERYDWFKEKAAIAFLDSIPSTTVENMKQNYCLGLHEIELAILAKQGI